MAVGLRSMHTGTTTSPAHARACCPGVVSSWKGRGSRLLARRSARKVGSCRSSGCRAQQRRRSTPTTVAASTSLSKSLRSHEPRRSLVLRRNPRLPPYSRRPPRPRCRLAGGSRACRGAPTQSRALPGVDPRRASTTRSPRCRSRGPLERRVPAVPPYPTPAPCPTRPTTLARLCSPGLGAPLVECAVGCPAACRRQLRAWSLDHAAAAWCARRAPVG